MSKLTLKNLKIVRKYLSAFFLPILAKIGGRTATEIPWPTDIFCAPFRVYLQNFRPPGNNAWRAVSSKLIELTGFGAKLK